MIQTNQRKITKKQQNLDRFFILSKAHKLSLDISKEIQIKMENTSASKAWLEPLALLSTDKRSVPLDHNDNESVSSLISQFVNFFNTLRLLIWEDDAFLSSKATFLVDWFALILKSGDNDSKMFPFFRFGGDQGADKLIEMACSPKNRPYFLLLSDIAASKDISKYMAIIMYASSKKNHCRTNTAILNSAKNVMEVWSKDDVLYIGMCGPDWIPDNYKGSDSLNNTEDIIKELIQKSEPEACYLHIEPEQRPSCFGPENENLLIPSKFRRLLSLYYLHLSPNKRLEMSTKGHKLFCVGWYLCPFFGRHYGAGGVCEVLVKLKPKSGLIEKFLDFKRVVFMRSITLALIAGFEDLALYSKGSSQGAASVLHHLPFAVHSAFSYLRKHETECKKHAEKCKNSPTFQIPPVLFETAFMAALPYLNRDPNLFDIAVPDIEEEETLFKEKGFSIDLFNHLTYEGSPKGLARVLAECRCPALEKGRVKVHLDVKGYNLQFELNNDPRNIKILLCLLIILLKEALQHSANYANKREENEVIIAVNISENYVEIINPFDKKEKTILTQYDSQYKDINALKEHLPKNIHFEMPYGENDIWKAIFCVIL